MLVTMMSQTRDLRRAHFVIRVGTCNGFEKRNLSLTISSSSQFAGRIVRPLEVNSAPGCCADGESLIIACQKVTYSKFEVE